MAPCSFVTFVLIVQCLVTSNAAPSDIFDTSLRLPAKCKGEEFCSIKPEGYEQLEEKINSALPEFLLKADSGFDDRLGEDELFDGELLSQQEDWHNCPTVTKYESMYLYNHGGNNTKIDVFVQTNLFKQYVKVVNCAVTHIDENSDEQCFQDMRIKDSGMQSKCVSSKTTRTLYVYDHKRNIVVQKSYEVPACCTCRVTYSI